MIRPDPTRSSEDPCGQCGRAWRTHTCAEVDVCIASAAEQVRAACAGNADQLVRSALEALLEWRRAARSVRRAAPLSGATPLAQVAHVAHAKLALAGDKLLALADAGVDPAARAFPTGAPR